MKSGYKALKQIANRAWYCNANIVQKHTLQNPFQSEFFCSIDKSVNLPGFQAEELRHCKKVELSTGYNTYTGSVTDSPVQFHGNIGKVVDTVEYASSDKYFIKKYKNVDNFFAHPILSSQVGLFYLMN